MPEFRESLAHFLYLFCLWKYYRNHTSFVLLGLWADYSAAEVKRTGRAKNGLVQKLDATCTFKRGSKGHQTCLFPQPFRKTKARKNPPSLETLELKVIEHSSRAIFLTFGSMRLKVAYLTHTSIQWYKRAHWDLCIKTVSKENRGKIGLALEFKDYIIAFITNDLVFQPVWEEAFDRKKKKWNLSPISPSIYNDYLFFLTKVANWIRARAKGARSGLACEVMRATQDVWCGVGVYTVCELFFDAGVSPFLTEAEVFDCPSRTARLCEAFFSYAYRSYKKLPALLRAATVDDILAPTQEQRLKYMYWLHVYGKDSTMIPARLGKLVDTYNTTLKTLESQPLCWYRDDDQLSLPDAFDPMYIREAFEKKELTLGHLIFGRKHWMSLHGQTSPITDPLTLLYAQCGLLDAKTNLLLDQYEDLYPSQKRSDFVYRTTYAYGAKKQIWSIVRCFPLNSYSSPGLKAKDSRVNEEFTGAERRRRLFSVIVNESQGVAIGPLEYCGHGRILQLPSGKKQLSLVHKMDPSLSISQITRQAKHEFRLKNNLDRRGQAKRAMTERQRAAQIEFVNNALEAHRSSIALSQGLSSSSRPPSPNSNLPMDIVPPKKKRRISQDKKIALAVQESQEETGRETCRSRRQHIHVTP